jgi:hypothetical protein
LLSEPEPNGCVAAVSGFGTSVRGSEQGKLWKRQTTMLGSL